MKSTSLLGNGEVSHKRQSAEAGSAAAQNSSAVEEVHVVVEDGTVGKWCELSRESPAGADPEFMVGNGPKNWSRRAVRASVVALKRGNARGAKGCRKMEAR